MSKPENPSNSTKTLAFINRALEERQGSGFRRHLGASVIGRDCARQLWYIFRWAKKVRHYGRMLRLFDRGNLEEKRFQSWLTQAGISVYAIDINTGEQFRISDHWDHFGGSLDSLLYDTPDFPGEWILGEFKTHNDKSYKELRKNGVKKSKPEHYAQMQVYMRKFGLRAAMYFAVNKNDDDLHIEIVYLDSQYADQLVDRAGRVIFSDLPPQRISESPGWYQCQWCDYKKICHSNEPMEVNCRTCVHSVPVEDGGWLCRLYHYPLTERDQRRGCSSHEPIRQ